MQRFRHIVLSITLALSAGACERDEAIRTYQAPKEQAPTPPQQTAPSNPVLAWTVPDGWVQEGPRQMRVATFRTSSDPDAAELVITRFGADNFGGMLDNINRWRGMVGLEPVKDEKDQPAQRVTVAGNDAALFDMTGATRRLRLVMVPAGDTVWFFRLIGSAEAVQQNVDKLDEFLKSVKFPT